MPGYHPGRFRTGAWGILLAAAAAAFALTRLQIDNRHEILLDDTTPAAREYERFVEQFGSDDFILIALSGQPLFALPSLDAMLQTLDRLEATPGVADVTGIPAIFRDRFGEEDPEALEEEMVATPFYTGLLLSEDESTAGLVVQIDPPASAPERGELVTSIESAAQPLRDAGFRVDFVGGPVFDEALNALSLRESLRMFPLAALLSLVVLLALLRTWKAVLVVLICGFVTLVILMGGITATGRSFNIVTASLPLVLWVLAIANGIHVAVRYQRFVYQGAGPPEAATKALEEVRFPCALASITTAFGFLSLLVADVGPIRELGTYMAIGMIVSLAVNLVLGPYLLVRFAAGAPAVMLSEKSRFMERAAGSVIALRWPIIGIFVAFLGLGVYSTTRIHSETDTFRYLPDDSPLVGSYDFVREQLTGLSSLEIMLDTPGTWLNPAYWPPVERMASRFEHVAYVGKVLTPLEFLKKIHQWDADLEPESYRLPDSEAEARDLMDLLEPEERAELNRYISPNDERIRMSVFVDSRSSSTHRQLKKIADEEMAKLPAPLGGTVTGMVARTSDMTSGLVDTQFRSYGVAFLLVFVSMFIGLQSVKLLLLSIVPNIIPVLTVVIFMAALGIALDVATVMVASISLGIAVDDTVHFLAGYQYHSRRRLSRFEAIRETMSKVGASITVTTVTACIGFFTLAFSQFVPISYFGLLSGLAILMALAADLFLLPAMLAIAGDTRPE